MSRFKKPWVLLAPTFILTLGGLTPAYAADGPPLPAPLAEDACGSQKDKVYVSNDTDPTSEVGWQDSNGKYYTAGSSSSTAGAVSLTLTVTIWSASGMTQYTYPPVTFGTEPDSTCVEAADTVSTRVVECNTSTSGTRVEFVYTNTDDASNRSHTRPNLLVDRWDHGQSAFILWTEGEVADGASLSITGGDTAIGGTTGTDFFLAPGTYTLTLGTSEAGKKLQPNRLFVPACGKYKPPKGDPMGGPIPPTVTIDSCRNHGVKVRADGRASSEATGLRVVANPARGKTVRASGVVDAGRKKTFTLRGLHSGKVMVKVRLGGTTIKRKVTC
jgi:hypothetical protein